MDNEVVVQGHTPLDTSQMISDFKSKKSVQPLQRSSRKYSKFTFSTPQYLEALKTAHLREDDVLIGGYPKTGQTLMEALVTLVLSGGDVDKLNSNYNFLRTPFLDAFDSDTSNGLVRLADVKNTPRTLRSHLPADMLPRDVANKQIKTIYTVRDLKDTMVSLYHFCRSYVQIGAYDGDWNDFFDIIMSGDIPYGHAADHFLSWWRHRRVFNVLFVRYEDMVSNRSKVVKRLAEFLGVEMKESQVNVIVNATSFSSMRTNDKLNLTPLAMAIDQSISPFIRKGVVGDWTTHFTSEQARMFDARFRRQTAEIGTMVNGWF